MRRDRYVLGSQDLIARNRLAYENTGFVAAIADR